MVQNNNPPVSSAVFLFKLMFSVIDFNVLSSYLFFLMFFFHLCHSIHVQTSIIFTETYFIIPYIVFHLCSIVAAKAKRFYAICVGISYRGCNMVYFVA